MTLPKGHLSPTQLNAWERCQVQYRIFTVEGAKAPPDFVLFAKQRTHKVLLEHDLSQKIKTGSNLGDTELSELYRLQMEQDGLPLTKEDPNFEGNAGKILEEEVGYFGKVVAATRPWRQKVVPLAVEQRLEGEIGGVPVLGYLDLLSDEVICHRIEDLKRQGGVPGAAEHSRQLVTYATLTGVPDVGLTAVVENKYPVLRQSKGQVNKEEMERVKVQYQGTADEIENAMQKDRWKPVDHSDQRKAWICSAKFCGAWRKDAKDWLTGRNISCPYGQRSETVVSLSVVGGTEP